MQNEWYDDGTTEEDEAKELDEQRKRQAKHPKDDLFYEYDEKDKVVIFGQYFPQPMDDYKNNTHTSLKLYQKNEHYGKSYFIYGEGLIDCSGWNKWGAKSFDNSDIRLIKINTIYKVKILLKNEQYLKYDIIEYHPAYSYNNILYIPVKWKILRIKIKRVRNEEFFKARNAFEAFEYGQKCKNENLRYVTYYGLDEFNDRNGYHLRRARLSAPWLIVFFLIIALLMLLGVIYYLRRKIREDCGKIQDLKNS